VTRSLHRSLLLGMVLADLEPCWLPTAIDAGTGMPLGVAVEDVEATLAANPDARAVLITEPGYLGTLSDVGRIIEVAHHYDVPVIVDQAWERISVTTRSCRRMPCRSERTRWLRASTSSSPVTPRRAWYAPAPSA